MKRISESTKILLLLAAVFLLTVLSCNKEHDPEIFHTEGYLLRATLIQGEIVTINLYDNTQRISEVQTSLYCTKYTYNEKGYLIKRESAFDESVLFSSIAQPLNRKLMTIADSEITSYNIYSYDRNNHLSSIENYFKKDGVYQLTSVNTFEYDTNGRIGKFNYIDPESDLVKQFVTYEYDSRGNVSKSKDFSLMNSEGTPKLISESSFKYDNKNNPLRVFAQQALPGIYTNVNNIVETVSVSYEIVPGIAQNTISKSIYTYNSNGFPIKITTGNNSYEYRYE